MALWAGRKKRIQQLEWWSEKKDCSRRQLVANYALHQHKTSSANEITHIPHLFHTLFLALNIQEKSPTRSGAVQNSHYCLLRRLRHCQRSSHSNNMLGIRGDDLIMSPMSMYLICEDSKRGFKRPHEEL